MGGCSESTMDELPKHATGVPQRFEWHPFRYIDFKEQARIRKQPVGRNPIKVAARGQRFYMDYGFIRASNEDYSKPTISKDRVVESYDGYTSYLLIVDETSKYSWIFLTKLKDPPIELTLPDLSALKVFGSRVCVKVTGKRRSKLDRHDFSGIFTGYTATDDNIRYIDVDIGVTKASHHAVFDEAWYLQPSRPPMAQLLYDMGMENEIEPILAPRLEPIPKAPYPPILNGPNKPLPKLAIQIPIPIGLSESLNATNARAAKIQSPHVNTALEEHIINRLDIIKDMKLIAKRYLPKYTSQHHHITNHLKKN
jgi:hypothetical protein